MVECGERQRNPISGGDRIDDIGVLEPGHKHASGGVIEQIGKSRGIEWRILLVRME